AQFPTAAMHLAFAQMVALRATEIAQDVIPSPARIAHLAPEVIVARLATHVDHAIDGGAATENLSSRIVQHPAVEACLRLRLVAPVQKRIAHGIEIAHGHMDPEPIDEIGSAS